MIKKPTTLILGAGASQPFDFPSGYGLLEHVINSLRATQYATDGFAYSHKALFNQLGFNDRSVIAFTNALLKCGKMSVDAFLEHRPEFVGIGKIAIALSLIPHEKPENLMRRDRKSWYEYLFYHLSTGVSFDDFSNNRLSILTFNYDRSLEVFLLNALHHSFGKSYETSVEKMKSIQILHLHGDLGGLQSLQNEKTRQYEPNLSLESVKVAAERIKIIHEGKDDDPQFQKAKNLLQESHTICFLGFGYHPINIKRLGFPECLGERYSKYVTGTSYGESQKRMEHISRTHFESNLHFLEGFGQDVLSFLKYTALLES